MRNAKTKDDDDDDAKTVSCFQSVQNGMYDY